MSQPTINPNPRLNDLTESLSITSKQKDIACKIRQCQIVSLISAVVAAVLLLTVLILQLIPGVPIAFSIVLGLTLVVATAVSLIFFASYFLKIRKVLFDLSEASAELREAFANFSLDLIRNIEPQKITQPPRYGLRTRTRAPRVSTQESSIRPPSLAPTPTLPPVSTPTPPVAPTEERLAEIFEPSPGEAPAEAPDVLPHVQEEVPPGSVAEEPAAAAGPSVEMDVDSLFQSSLLHFLDIADRGVHPGIDKHPRYKKDHNTACKTFSNFCGNIARFWNKVKKGEIPVTTGEILSMFTPPIFGRDNHPVLSITYSGKDAFSSEIYGAFWLHDALKDPEKLEKLLDVIRVLKMSNLSLRTQEEQLVAYTASLVTFNVLLSGWCLCNQNLASNIVGSVQALRISEEDKMMVLEMLNSGNVLGALVFVHGDRNPEVKALMRINDLDPEGNPLPDPQNAINILYEHIDPYSARAITIMGDLAETSSEQDETLVKEAQRIFEKLGASLPMTAAGLGYDIWNRGNTDLNAASLEASQFLMNNPPASTSKMFSFLRAVRGAPKLQSRLKNYLPYAGKEAIGALLSTLILGGYSLGLFTYRQIDGLCSALGISERELIRSILSKKIAGEILPKLL